MWSYIRCGEWKATAANCGCYNRAVMASKSAEAAPFRSIFSNASLVALVALLLAETTINYINRQTLSVLAPTLRDEFELSNSQLATIQNAFMITYVFSYALAGWVIDRLGVGRGLSLAMVWWSVAGMLTSLSRGFWSMVFFRSVLAVGAGGAWPSFAKAVAKWVPAKARALAMGACNCGSSMGLDDHAAAGGFRGGAIRLAGGFRGGRGNRVRVAGGVSRLSALPSADAGDGPGAIRA